MVFTGRTQSFVSGYHTSRRAASVPVANYGDTIDVVVQPVVRTKTYSIAPRRSYLDGDVYAASRSHDAQFLRDITSRLPTIGLETRLPPAPIIVDPFVSRIGYATRASIQPVVHQEYSSYSAPSHHHHHLRSASLDHRHRAPLVHRRSDEMDSEVQAFLESTPQSRYSHSHSHSHPSSYSYSRSISSPPVGNYSSSYHHRYQPSFHPPPPTFPPSYALQHQYQPSGTGSSGWTTYGSYSSEIPLSHSTYAPSYHLSTHVSPPEPVYFSHAPVQQATTFVSSVYRPLANYTPSTQVRSSSLHSRPLSYASPHHYSPSLGAGSGHVSIDLALANRPAPLASSYSGSSHLTSGLPLHSSSSSSYSPSPRSRYDAKSYDLPKPSSSSSSSNVRSSSLDTPRPKANYKDVKPPISDTRRRVRDLICKTRKDANYYD